MPSSSSLPFPVIPTEIESHILSFCDQSTLAKCLTVSLAFLQLSSPLLYEDVVLHGIKNIRKLLCARPDPSYQSPLHPYFALTQIKQLSVYIMKGDAPKDWVNGDQDPIDFNQDRHPPSNPPLPLRSLSILLPSNAPMHLGRKLDKLLALCDPTSFHLTGYGPLQNGREEVILPDLDCFRLEWKRIKLFVLQGATWHHSISFHLSRSTPFSFKVRYDLSLFRVGTPLWWMALDSVVLDATQTNLLPETLGRSGFIVDGMERATVLVATEEGKRKAFDQLKERCEGKFGRVAWEKMEKNIEIVVVGA